MTEKAPTTVPKKKENRGALQAQKVLDGTYKKPSVHIQPWHDAADKLHSQLKAIGCSRPGGLELLDYWPSVGRTSKAIYAHLLLCRERKIVDIEFQDGAGFHGIVKFVINDLDAFDAGPDAYQVVHSIAWARVPGRSMKLKTIAKQWNDIGFEESPIAWPIEYAYNAKRMEKRARAMEDKKRAGPTKEQATPQTDPVMSSYGAPCALPVADGAAMAVVRPVPVRLIPMPAVAVPVRVVSMSPSAFTRVGSGQLPPTSSDSSHDLLHFVDALAENVPAGAPAPTRNVDNGLDFVCDGANSALDVLASVAVSHCPNKKQRVADA